MKRSVLVGFLISVFLLSLILLISCTSHKKVSGEAAGQAKQKIQEEGLDVPLKTFEGKDYIDPAGKIAVIETNMGIIKIRLFPDKAPNTVQSFIHLANDKFFDGLTFHRIIDGFVIQGGCPLGDGTGGPGYRLKEEFNDAPHVLGAISMARAEHPDTAGSQFFICLAPLPKLDNKYAVFGETIEGLDVVQAIGKVKTDSRDRPLEPVIIKSIRIVDTK